MSIDLPVFVGSLPGRRSGELTRAIERVMARYPALRLCFGDREAAGPERFRRILTAIDRSFLCLLDVSSRSRPEGYFEFGYALGRGCCCVLLSRRRSRSVEELEGYERIEFESPQELRRRLEEALPRILGAAIWRITQIENSRFGQIDAKLVGVVGEALTSGRSLDRDLESSRLGLSVEQFVATADVFASLGLAVAREDGWGITDLGSACIPELLAAAR